MTIIIETEEKYLPAFKALAKAVGAKIRVQKSVVPTKQGLEQPKSNQA